MDNLFDKDRQIGAKKLEIYEFNSLSVTHKYGKELFEGYDELYAITYSSGISFMSSILKGFKKAEIIFGYPPVLSKKYIRLVSFQLNVLKTLIHDKDALFISDLMSKGILSMFTSNDVKSHEKLYLLKGNGKYRVILGSANMSGSAFNGLQREIILCSENKESFDLLKKRFVYLRDNCTSPISSEKIKSFVENNIDPSSFVDNAPIVEDVLGDNANREYVESSDANNTDFTFEINEEQFGEEKFDEYASRSKSNNGFNKSLITPDSVRKCVDKSKSIKEQVAINPSLDINYNNNTISIGEHLFNLNPSSERIRFEIDLVVKYFDGWNIVDSHATRYRRIFWRLFVWYFTSPFIPYLRSLALEYHRDVNFKYPMFSLLYGKSNCGKTKFLQFMTRLITGREALVLEGKNVTCSKLDKYKYNCRNLPLNVDEVSKGRWRSYSTLIKEDTFGYKKNNGYAPVVFVTNEIESITMDLRKRCISLNLDSAIDFKKTINNDAFIKILDSTLDHNALFCEFASRMFPQIENLASKIKNHKDEAQDNILHSASLVLKEIFEEYLQTVPEYVRELLLVGDYFDALEMGRTALEALELGLKVEPELFTFNEKENLLVYKNPGITDKRVLDNIKNELPASWEAKVTLGSLSMNLKEARNYFNLVKDSFVSNQGIECLKVALKSESELFKIKEGFLIYKGSLQRLSEIKNLLPSDWDVTVTGSCLVIPLNTVKDVLDLSNIKHIQTKSSCNILKKLFNI